ncbi:hypothetical protein [Streptomyces zingiberis]|uniref:hypothetical protein n=1 Tax=Streptomyces zingiberis TaxID=2053010 RepID=UPI001F0DBB43|nr:hypothetical protein [Streptomyces zingiberis]
MEPRQWWERNTVLAEAFCRSDEQVRSAQARLDEEQVHRARLLAAFAVTVGDDGAVAGMLGLTEREVRLARRTVGKSGAREVAEEVLAGAGPGEPAPGELPETAPGGAGTPDATGPAVTGQDTPGPGAETPDPASHHHAWSGTPYTAAHQPHHQQHHQQNWQYQYQQGHSYPQGQSYQQSQAYAHQQQHQSYGYGQPQLQSSSPTSSASSAQAPQTTRTTQASQPYTTSSQLQPQQREPRWSGAMDALLVGGRQTGVDLQVLAAEFGLDLARLVARAQQLSAEGRLSSPWAGAGQGEENRSGRHRRDAVGAGYPARPAYPASAEHPYPRDAYDSYAYPLPTSWEVPSTVPEEMIAGVGHQSVRPYTHSTAS